MKRYIKSTQSIFAGYSCNGWFNILKNQKIPDDIEQFNYDYTAQYDYKKQYRNWCYFPKDHPNYVEDGFESVAKYTSGYDRDINSYLRGLPYKNDPGLWSDKLTTEEKADRIHHTISNAKLPYDIVTVRWADIDNLISYLGEDAPENIKNGDGDQYIGHIVKERGFYSSSMSMYPKQVIWGYREVQFITLLPKGTSAIYIDEGVSRMGREDEILLLDGSSFIIRDIQYSENGFDYSSGLQSNSKYRIFMEKI